MRFPKYLFNELESLNLFNENSNRHTSEFERRTFWLRDTHGLKRQQLNQCIAHVNI